MRGVSRFLASVACVLGISLPAEACGGGSVSRTLASIGANAQRIFLSVRADHTDVVTQIVVPATTADYGVLIPLPAEPTLDPEPVDSSDLDALDQATAPQVTVREDGGGGGCGCPFVSGSADSAVPQRGGAVKVSEPVNIGPVTAVVLQGDTGDAVNGWLAENGFVLPSDSAALVDEYSGAGHYFVAIKRNEATAPGGPTSIGVHFTVPGDQRGLPLRFTRMGAGEKVAFTLFVAAPHQAVGPSLPFVALTLDDLDADTLRGAGYAAAVEKAVNGESQRAFVVEGVHSSQEVTSLGSRWAGLVDPTEQVTRLATILPVFSLTEDVRFDEAFTGTAPDTRTVRLAPGMGPRGVSFGAAVALGGAMFRRRRRRG